jgi:hypothetical protein
MSTFEGYNHNSDSNTNTQIELEWHWHNRFDYNDIINDIVDTNNKETLPIDENTKSENLIETEPEAKDRIILYHNYLLDEVIKKTKENIEEKKISCRVCLQNFTGKEKHLYICHSCSNLCHLKCGKKTLSKCPYCRVVNPSSTKYWYNIIGADSTIFDAINSLVTVEQLFQELINYKNTPVGLIPTLENEYKGITQKIQKTFDAIDNDTCTSNIIKNTMELSNYVMLKCQQIDRSYKNIISVEEQTENKFKSLLRKEAEIDIKLDEIRRQNEILEGIKLYLGGAIQRIDQNVRVETKELFDTGDTEDKIKSWETMETDKTMMDTESH